jgi:hypothetical protein
MIYEPLYRGVVTLQTIAWDDLSARTPMLATLTPQEAINRRMPLPSDCQIVIVIFWSRMGTPLPKEYVKPDGDIYLSGTEWEYIDAVVGARKSPSNLPLVIVYRRTEEPVIRLNAPDFTERHQQYNLVEKFFRQFTNEDGSLVGGYNQYNTPDEFRRLFEVDLKEAISTILSIDDKLNKDVPSNQTAIKKLEWSGSPFPGLRSYTQKDASIFFGRGREIDDLIALLSQNKFVAVIGASGSGKSSLVWAGLIPRLEANAISDEKTGSKEWIWIRFTPGGTGDNPFMALAVKLEPFLEQYGWRATDIAEKLVLNPSSFIDFSTQIFINQPDWTEILLFIDQFEELLTIVRKDYLLPFVELLTTSLKHSRFRIIVTLRADFYQKAIAISQLTNLLRIGSYPLAAPDSIALHSMITRPAEIAGLKFENHLARRIVNDVGNEPGSLALMAYALDELYQTHSSDLGLTHKEYEDIGGVQGAIGNRAEKTFLLLSREVQDILPFVFQSLVNVDERGTATRRRTLRSELVVNDAANKLIENLTESRLFVQSDENGNPTIEVAHEALLRSWPRLASWIEKTQDDLRLLKQVNEAANLWDENYRASAFLWPDERLKLVHSMLKRLQPVTSETTKMFVRPELDRLVLELENLNLAHLRRSSIGERLSIIGDTRQGVGLRADNGLPDIVWCKVPGGNIQIHSQGFRIVPFYIAKYPVTMIQFQKFLEEGDYFSEKWWKYLKKPDSPPLQKFKVSNYPCDSISWGDAIAFCRWLTESLSSDTFQDSISNNKEKTTWFVRLPTEWEWEYAATGGQSSFQYPWGKNWDSNLANTAESGLSRTTAVGMYPLAKSPTGALDMSGNVREWCVNEYDSMKTSIDDQIAVRALRGGSWANSKKDAMTTTRLFDNPEFRASNVGFRVALINTQTRRETDEIW